MAWQQNTTWAAGSTRTWRKQRTQILQRDNHTCTIQSPTCTHHATEVDHITNKAAGGTDHPTNLRATCTPCHKQLTQQQAQQGRTNKHTHRKPMPHPTDT